MERMDWEEVQEQLAEARGHVMVAERLLRRLQLERLDLAATVAAFRLSGALKWLDDVVGKVNIRATPISLSPLDRAERAACATEVVE